MGLTNKSNLKTQAEQIRYEDGEGMNTAERVGKVLAEIVESVDSSLTTESNARSQADNTLTQNLSIASNTASTAYTTANEAKSKAVAAQSTADLALSSAGAAQSTANEAKSKAVALENKIGMPNGIAPLDATMKVPAANLPSFVDDVVEFNAFVDDVTPQQASIDKSANDIGCMVVYDRVKNVFMLAVATIQNITEESWTAIKTPARAAATPSPTIVGGDVAVSINPSEFWEYKNDELVVISSKFTYYNNWKGAEAYGSTGTLYGKVPDAGKIYTSTSDNKTFRWSGSTLITIGSDLALGHTSNTAFPGNEGVELQREIENFEEDADDRFNDVELRLNEVGIEVIKIVSTPEELPHQTSERDFWYVESEKEVMFVDDYDQGYCQGYLREDRLYRCQNQLYRYDGRQLVTVGGAADGNCLNVSVEFEKTDTPLDPYYTLEQAINKVYNSGRAKLGLQITFAISATTWKQYQYVGKSLTSEDFCVESNWNDMAAMSAGSEPTINVNELCKYDGTYTLAQAVNALLTYQTTSGITYAKEGLVIYFKSDERKWEQRQFRGKIVDGNTAEFLKEELWAEIGGGGSDVQTKDAVEKGGKDAFSTGGAYDAIPAKIVNNAEEGSGVAKLQLVNAAGEAIGDELQLGLGSGTGAAAVIIRIELDKTPVYGALGSDVKANASIRSYLSTEPDSAGNGIVKLELVDLTTGITVWTDNSAKASSPTTDMFTFPLDFTPYFTDAASKKFRLLVTDDAGNTGRKDISVTVVDVTVVSQQTLNYTSSQTFVEGGDTKSVTICQFPVNTSKNIEWVTEMYYNGVWKELGRKIVADTYIQSITINPKNLFGGNEKMLHGGYPIRFWGVDKDSNVKGNTVYSTLMCVNPDSTTPIVAIRFDDKNDGNVRLYDSLTFDVAAYTPGKPSTDVDVYIDGKVVTTKTALQGQTYTISQQINGYDTDGTKKITFYAKAGTSTSNSIKVTVSGSAIGAYLKDGANFGYDFSTRDNSETDHSISDNGITMDVIGSNWSSNGFVDYLGEKCLRIAENVTAKVNYAPFALSSVENTTGMALQFAFATNNIKDPDAKLMECYDPSQGAGFYITGNSVVVTCANGEPKQVMRKFNCGEKITVAVVVRPSTISYERGGVKYSTIDLYVNGEWCGCLGYVSGSGAILNRSTITFNGTEGDFYLYYMLQYESYYAWTQAFQNYLCKLTDTDAMIAEYQAESVLNENNIPSLDALKEREIGYYVIVADKEVFDAFDSDVDTSKKFECTLYYYHPTKPWRSFKAIHVQWRRQGTTSAKRPIKNDRFYLQKNEGWKVTPLYPDYTNADALTTYALFELGLIRVGDNTFPVKVITTKVDFSDSSNANDCGVCDMMNATFRALGANYMTPIQKAFDANGGTWSKGSVSLSGIQLNHSTANHPVAVFRSTNESLTDAYFHAKGNWKEDKGEQVALGFKDIPGYNKGCKNYGDFVEFFGTRGETLNEIETRFKATSGLDTSKLYLLSLYCGRDYRFMAWNGSQWVKQTGSLTWNANGTTKITGTVLNPVTGYELITYDGFDWWQGVGSIDEMMAPTTTESSWVSKLNLKQASYPAWTQYFECMVDDDQLQIDLAMGRKVPYELYAMLEFCNSCDYARADLQTKITDDWSESGEKIEKWKDIWRKEAYKHLSPYSLMAYYTFTDYLAAVDQQAKNMQPMFFLDENGSCVDGVYASSDAREPIRMYLNKVYDCDTCNGKDNEGGNSIKATLDPSNLNDDSYAGRGSVLWNNLRGQQTMRVSSDGTINLMSVVATMRSLPSTEIVGGPFSPQGAKEYFVNRRMKKWPKLVSSYDGNRKYVESTPRADALYFYALQGLGLTSLPAFIDERWRYRDGYYQTGEFTNSDYRIGERIAAKAGAIIKFKAAKSGYFGIGNDGGNITKGVYLNAGESYTFGASDFQHGDDVALYIYNADLMSELDLSQIVLSEKWGSQFSKMRLVEKLTLGSVAHKNWDVSIFTKYGRMQTLTLGDLPFLTHLDVRNTEVTSINASQCPRLVSVLADGTSLTSLSIAEASPVETISLPATMTEMKFVNLPNLSYPGGLTVAGFSYVRDVFLKGCPNIDTEILLINIASNTTQLRTVGVRGINATASIDILRKIKTSGATGYDANGNSIDETGKCSGLEGRWISSTLVSDAELAELQAYFQSGGLTLFNAQYSCVMYDDTSADSQNITNLDNGTIGDEYEPSGHFVRLRDKSHAYKCTYDSVASKMLCVQVSDENYSMLADGTSYDPSDTSGIGFDIMKMLPSYWYKGVNDFKNQKKYFFLSTLETEPISTSMAIKRVALADARVREYSSVYVKIGNSLVAAGADVTYADNANHNVYEIDVEGMKQVRWPGVNNDLIGAVFVDENDKVVAPFFMYVTHALFDFTNGEYVFTDVPAGAKKLIFTSPVGFEELEAIAVDSSAIEAIEPDWVHTRDRLVGVYGIYVDNLMRPRSISGYVTRRGDNNSNTNGDWKYDSEGRVNNTTVPTSTMHYTCKDFMNLCEMRGNGFHAIDYEMSKDISNIVMALLGDRDVQAQCGYGCGSGYTTGSNSFNTYGNVTRIYSGTNIGNIIFGIQNFVACNYEWMDNIACNVQTFAQFKKNKCVGVTADPIDAKYHIYDPVSKTERVVQGLSSGEYCIARVKFGRYCDTLASRLSTDKSLWNEHYGDGYYITNDRGRVVGRASNYANAYGGLVCSHAHYVSSNSGTSVGSRLAFSGDIEIVENEQ